MTAPRESRCDTLVSLKDYLESRLDANQSAVDAARTLMEARMERQEIETERRLDGLNHLRENTISKPEYAAKHAELAAEFHTAAARLEEKVAGLLEWKAEQRGKASVGAVMLSVGIAVIGLLVSVVALVHEMMQ